jgi:hypothetical protein
MCVESRDDALCSVSCGLFLPSLGVLLFVGGFYTVLFVLYKLYRTVLVLYGVQYGVENTRTDSTSRERETDPYPVNLTPYICFIYTYTKNKQYLFS